MISDRIELLLEPGWFWAALCLAVVICGIIAFAAAVGSWWLCLRWPAFCAWLTERRFRKFWKRQNRKAVRL